MNLKWTTSNNGHVEIADSGIIGPPGDVPLRWYLAGGDGHWGLDLSGDAGRVFYEKTAGTIDDAREFAQKFEDEHAGTVFTVRRVQVIQRYHLIGGGYATRIIALVFEPLHIGELNLDYAEPAARKFRRQRAAGKVLRFVADGAVAIVPTQQVAMMTVLQRHEDGQEFLGEPGWRVAAAETGAGPADKTGAGPADKKGAEAALEHLRGHVAGLVINGPEVADSRG